jgi:hypothetical protein
LRLTRNPLLYAVLYQTKSHGVRSFFAVGIFLLFAASRAFATSVIAPSFDDLVTRADLIFTGQVISQHSEWRDTGGKRSIVTIVKFGIEQIHKGKAGVTVKLQFLGGAIGAVTLDVSDMPKFTQGERVVLFVEKNSVNASPLIGFYHGKFSLHKDASGRDAVLKHNGEALVDVAELGRSKRAGGHASQSGLSHAEFAIKVRERLSPRSSK